MNGHTEANQRYWDIITWEFPVSGPEDEANELFWVIEPLSATVPEEFSF